MKRILHPLWTHLPAVAVFIIFIIFVIISGPLPATVPIHFNSQGVPNAYGSPWTIIGLNLGISMLFIATSVTFDELWVRQESKKTFNWLSLFDEITVGAMTGIFVGHLQFIRSGGPVFTFPWFYFIVFLGSAVVLAVILERARPYRPHAENPATDISTADLNFKVMITGKLKEKALFVYWDCQNPVWVSLITIVIPLVLIISAAISWLEQPLVSFVLLPVAILMIIPYGGQRILVTQNNITVRWGILGLQVFHTRIENIALVETHRFSPLRDFGGYGIRFNREMTAYYLRGDRGIKITNLHGRKYLIGSDNPERLVEVIQAIRGK
jgi:hypothetical protein